MKLTLSAPSKTFLVGEYSVLKGGSALVLNTSPRFQLQVTAGQGEVEGIPEGAPACRWLKARSPLWANYNLKFIDPHKGLGGLGASGAQFLLCHAFTTALQQSFADAMRGPDVTAAWQDHQVLTNEQGSGADIWAQSTGRVAEIHMSEPAAKAREWPYPDLSWVIVRTHQKVATHEHLSALDRSQLSLLVRPAQDCIECFATGREEVFLSKLKEFTAILRKLELQAASTLSLSNLLENEPWCLLAKGCGALGADTVLCLYPTVEREKVQTFLKKQHLTVIASHSDLVGGLEITWS